MTTKLKARPTVYKGIQMRSRLEAGFAAWMDQKGIDWEYEPSAFASELGQYLPDFRVTGGLILPGSWITFEIFFEVKPEKPSWDEQQDNLSILQESIPNALLFVVWPGGSPGSHLQLGYRVAIPGGPEADREWYDFYFALDEERPSEHAEERRVVSLRLADSIMIGPWHGEWWKPGV